MTMHMRNGPEALGRGAWDWSILDGCFRGRIRPTDIDGMVEVEGELLFLEGKRLGDGVEDAVGRAYSRLVAIGARVIVIWGVEEPEGSHTFRPVALKVWGGPKRACGLEELRAEVRAWCQRVPDLASERRSREREAEDSRVTTALVRAIIGMTPDERLQLHQAVCLPEAAE